MLWQKKYKHTDRTATHDYQDYLSKKVGIDAQNKLPIDTLKLKVKLEQIFEQSADFNVRYIRFSSEQDIYLYYFGGSIDKNLLQQGVIKPLTERIQNSQEKKLTHLGELLDIVDIAELSDWNTMVQKCMKGYLICHFSGTSPVAINIMNMNKRSIDNPTTEQQVYGPKIGFIEDIHTNIAMMRKYFQDPRLKVKTYEVGTVSHTDIAVLHLEEYVDTNVLKKVYKRLENVTTDNIFNARILGQYLIDFPRSPFPLVFKTERPDKVAYALTQGKVAILIDNSTFCLIVPATLLSFYEAGDDNDESSTWAISFLMFLRLICIIIASVLPALYVALVAFHPELIPTTLAMTLAASRNNIPFPAGAEALIMMFALDVLVEASIRLPSFIGQTVGIVGGLVIGQAAVEAGIVSSAMVIVIAFTAIASFTAPSWEIATTWRLVRYYFLISAIILGLFGLTLAVCLLFMHLSALHSINKPYLSPFAPFNGKEVINIFYRIRTAARQAEDSDYEK